MTKPRSVTFKLYVLVFTDSFACLFGVRINRAQSTVFPSVKKQTSPLLRETHLKALIALSSRSK